NTVDFQNMQQIAEKYGVSLDALGSKFQGAKISSAAQQIITDFNALKDGGADAGGVLAGMSDEISSVVQQAMKAGVALPDAFKPMVQVLADSGQLLDANGDKITDIGKIQFAAPVEAGFDKIVQAINNLGDKLTNDLPRDFSTGIDKIQDRANRTDIRVPVGLDMPDFPDRAFPASMAPGGDQGANTDVPPPTATGGIV